MMFDLNDLLKTCVICTLPATIYTQSPTVLLLFVTSIAALSVFEYLDQKKVESTEMMQDQLIQLKQSMKDLEGKLALGFMGRK